MTFLSFVFGFFLFSCSLSFCWGDDQIHNLPGAPPINFKQYSGYITVNEENQRNLFYWFVESQRDPANDKLVLWLNGGPGCSSIGGLMTENGPFRPKKDGTLALNSYSWNRVANVIYLESPAGVGFSYSKVPSDYTTVGDKRTANDSYTFLLKFFQKYPQFQNRPFWITGESYGGHYVPELAKRIHDGNKEGNPHINLEGFMAGNAWTDMPIDNAGAVFYWWSHALISDETYKGIDKTCDFAHIGPLKETKLVSEKDCDQWLDQSSTEMGNINIYDIYVDVCTASKTKKILNQYARAGSKIHKALVGGINPPYQPCEDEFTARYMNRKEVQAALHANIDYPWSDCSSLVQYNYSDVEASVIPIYQYFFDNTNLKILVYSGDVDAIVPYTGTREWVSRLKRDILEPWRPWTVSEQVGGYVTKYKGFSLATVRNAGHMVPETQPERAFVMFNYTLNNLPLPQ